MQSVAVVLLLSGACFVVPGAASAAGSIDLEKPLDCQVLQRGEDEKAELAIAGKFDGAADRVEAEAVLTTGATRGRPLEWSVIDDGEAVRNGRFSGAVVLETGGWYTVRVRAKKGDEIIACGLVDKVGVGDVFVTAGQSNSSNFGAPRQNAEDDRVVYFDGASYVPARDPIPAGPGRSVGGGGTPWPILGDMLARTTQAPVCFRTATENWLRVRDWLPEAPTGNIQRLVERVREVGPEIRAVLWHQGEADSGREDATPTTRYAAELGAAIAWSRETLGYRLDWFVAGASYCPPPEEDAVSNPWHDSIRATQAAQKMLWEKGVAYRGPDTNDLVGIHRHDRIHFSQAGLRAHGERWYVVLCEQYKFANPMTYGKVEPNVEFLRRPEAEKPSDPAE